MHPELSVEERKEQLKLALRYVPDGRSGVRQSGHYSLDSYFHPPEEEKVEEVNPILPILPIGKTTQLLCYDIKTEKTLVQFHKWLQTIDGRSKKETTATQEARDVSKFLHQALDWDIITDRTKLSNYVDTLKKCNLQPSGIIQKLEYFEDGLKFYRIHLVKPESRKFREALQTSEVIRNWRSVLRKDKGMQHIHNMEIQSDGARTSIQDATEILHNTSVWEFYRSVVATASRGGAGVMDQRTLDSATYLLAHAVMVNSTQRPGAVISMTVDEFENANKETCLEGDVWVVRSHKHKTQAQGSANLIFTADLYK